MIDTVGPEAAPGRGNRTGHLMPNVTPSRRRIRLLALPLLATGLVVLAACGAATTTTSSSSGSGAGGSDAFAACMAENGVTAPTGGPGGGSGGGAPPTGTAGSPGNGGAVQAPPGVDTATWEAALEACASVAPTAPGGAAASATPSAGA
jgi:hypothetical protein